MHGIPEEELKFRDKCYAEIIKLNNGVDKSPLIVLKPLTGNAEGNKVQAAKACSMNAVSEETPKGDATVWTHR